MKSAVPSGEMSQSAFKNIPPFHPGGPLFSAEPPPNSQGDLGVLSRFQGWFHSPPHPSFLFSILRLRNQNYSAQEIKLEKKNTEHF